MRDVHGRGMPNRTVMGAQTAAVKPAARRDYFLPVVGLLILFAWVTLWLWEQSPYARYLHHGHWSESGPAAIICRVIPGGDIVVPAFMYVGGWTLMSTAMMLPTVLPLLEIFRRVTIRRTDQHILLSLVIAGYLLAWGGFGIVAHALSWIILEMIQGNTWLTRHGWVPAATIFLFAGMFQFSALKYRCLDKCRTPFAFVMQHWRGHHERRQSLWLGLHHGIYCVGCCWALMLLMFAVGTGSVGWMLALGALMAVEKNLPWGRRISTPLGVVLLGVSGSIMGQALAGT